MISNTSAPDLLHGVRETVAAAGLRHASDTDVWIDSRDEVVLKVTAAPDERPDASAIPGRLLEALRTGGYTLAAAPDSAAPDGMPPEAALRAGHSVRVTRT